MLLAIKGTRTQCVKLLNTIKNRILRIFYITSWNGKMINKKDKSYFKEVKKKKKRSKRCLFLDNINLLLKLTESMQGGIFSSNTNLKQNGND